MNSEGPPRRENIPKLNQCIENLRFAQATELVRSGKYLEAEEILTPKGQVPETARELDLLARMNAHQERFEDAARFWQAALKKDPGNSNYQNCLQQLSDIQTGNGLPDGGLRFVLRVGIGACAVFLIIGLVYWSHRTATTPVKVTIIEEKPVQPTPSSQSTTVVSPAATVTETLVENHRFEQALDLMQQTQKYQIQALAGQLAAIQTNQSTLLNGQKAARSQISALGESIVEFKKQQAEIQQTADLTHSELTLLTMALASTTRAQQLTSPHLPDPSDFNPETPGVIVTAQNNNWLISFNPGLFDRDEHFKIGAKARLESLAKALVQTQTKLNVKIVGFADNEPPTWPWSRQQTDNEIGLQRAKSVTAYLGSLKMFPPEKLSAISGDRAQLPFLAPNLNNRSVVLEVSPD